MRRCPKCGFLLNENDRYCENCGEDCSAVEDSETAETVSLNEPKDEQKEKLKKQWKIAGIVFGAGILFFVCVLGFVMLNISKNTTDNFVSGYNGITTASYREFIRNWNVLTENDSDFTNDVHIDENINYNFEIQLEDNAVLQCRQDKDNYYITYKKENMSKADYKNSLTEILKMVCPDNKEQFDSQVENYKQDSKGYVVSVEPDSYDIDFLNRYVQSEGVVFDTETGYASMNVSFSSFKNDFKSEYAKYLAGDDSSAITSEIRSEANNVVDTVLEPYSITQSDYWGSDVKEYYFDFARRGNFGMVRATIDVEQDNGKIVFVSISCSDNYLNDYYDDCCRMVTRSLGVSNKTIGNALKYSESEDLYSCIYRGVRYTRMTKSGLYSRMECYPYSKYEETEYTLINPKTETNDTALH